MKAIHGEADKQAMLVPQHDHCKRDTCADSCHRVDGEDEDHTESLPTNVRLQAQQQGVKLCFEMPLLSASWVKLASYALFRIRSLFPDFLHDCRLQGDSVLTIAVVTLADDTLSVLASPCHLPALQNCCHIALLVKSSESACMHPYNNNNNNRLHILAQVLGVCGPSPASPD